MGDKIQMTAQVKVYAGDENVVDPDEDFRLPRRSRSAARNRQGDSILFFDQEKSKNNNPFAISSRVVRENRSRSRHAALRHLVTTPGNLPWNHGQTNVKFLSNFTNYSSRRSSKEMTGLSESQI